MGTQKMIQETQTTIALGTNPSEKKTHDWVQIHFRRLSHLETQKTKMLSRTTSSFPRVSVCGIGNELSPVWTDVCPFRHFLDTVKADVKPKALDILHGVTMNKLTTLHVEMDGSSRPSDVDSRIPKCRKIKCKMCMEIFGSVKDLNIYHKQDHGIVKCTKCDKYFSTQSSLDKHSYTHGELKFNCELCGKCFPFESRLDQHMVVHTNNKLSCPKKSCDKQFKSIGDLNRHMKSHTKGGWYHCDHCDYKNKDKCNTDSHMRTHSTEERVDMNVTNVAKKCDSVPSLKDTVKRVAKSKNCHDNYQYGILKGLMTCGNYMVFIVMFVRVLLF